MDFSPPTLTQPGRRLAAATLSAAVLAVLAGEASAQQIAPRGNHRADIRLLNSVLSLDHEGIAAYELGIGSGLMRAETASLARRFQDHHKMHRDTVTEMIRRMGGRPVAARTNDEYATALNAASLRNEGDILNLAVRLEGGAANGYLALLPSLGDQASARLTGRILADEVMHWTILTNALGRPVPPNALSFGA